MTIRIEMGKHSYKTKHIHIVVLLMESGKQVKQFRSSVYS